MATSKETQQDIQVFITNLTGTKDTEVRGYLAEIETDTQFHQSMTGKWDGSGTKPFSLRVLGIDTTACLLLYTLCRIVKPDNVVETGVASGISSSYMLCALHKNKKGKLYSIDVPWYTVTENWKRHFKDGELKPEPIERQIGWMIPDYLRSRWELILGKSSEKLSPLLKKIGTIDIFFHDSQHTYETMFWEFSNSWPNIETGGVLIAHNINVNSAFSDFGQSINNKTVLLSGLNTELNRFLTTGAMMKL